MALIVFGPQWFFGIDSIFECISVVVVFLVAWFSHKAYKLTKEDRYQTMSRAFGLIGGGILAKIITNIFIYSSIKTTMPVQQIDILYDIGYLLSRYLYVLGLLLLLVMIVLKIKDRRNITLFALMSLLLIWISYYSYYVFHSLAAVLILFIVQHFYNNCQTSKKTTSKCVFMSFLCLLLAHLTFMAVEFWRPAYVLAEGLQLFGFLSLAANYIMIMRR